MIAYGSASSLGQEQSLERAITRSCGPALKKLDDDSGVVAMRIPINTGLIRMFQRKDWHSP